MTHFHPFFDKNVPLQVISHGKRPTATQFQQKQHNPTYFSTNSTTPTYFSTKKTHSHHSHPFSHQSSTNATCIHQFSSYNRRSLPVTLNALNELSLKTSSLNIRRQSKREKHISAKIKYIHQCYST